MRFSRPFLYLIASFIVVFFLGITGNDWISAEVFAKRQIKDVKTYSKKKSKRQKKRRKKNKAQASRITLTPKTKKGIRIRPKKSHREHTYFTLSRSKKKNRLVLSFHTKNRGLRLDTNKDFLIHIQAESPIKIDPYIIMKKHWPKGATKMLLKTKGLSKRKSMRVTGDAVYRVCSRKSKKCKRMRSRFKL